MTRQLPFPQPDPTAPPPEYAELRATCPIARVTTAEGAPAWLVTSYDAAGAVLGDTRFGMAPAGTATTLDPASESSATTGNDTLFQDGATHTRLRRLVTKAFTPRAIEALRPLIEQRSAELVDGMIARGRTADLVEDLAAPLSTAVISELVGVRLADRNRFRELAETISTAETAPEEAFGAWQELGAYSAGLIATKRDEPGEDLLSRLIAVRDDDNGRLSDEELIGMVATLVLAGYQTARNGICIAAIQLLRTGRLASLLTDEADAVLDEALRLLGGAIGNPMPRWAHEDVEVAGTHIAKGDQVLVRLDAANHDPAHFADPDEFRTDRKALPHMSFGRGAHHCLGASLARAEIGIALRTLAARLPGLSLSVPVTEIPWSPLTATDRGPESVPVSW
ncbi:cytochrome P450 [Allokutzneria albata]|uniref:Cytochrome P450 n=1 Tax=Allokutzneria albata TaxID=211114 RepID=A0A1G9T6A8_ALLAB|nr:cytochrome P450 [Allokutzneria albata]SDM43253.1 Cytochrome P450 [Allokutzneria albata]